MLNHDTILDSVGMLVTLASFQNNKESTCETEKWCDKQTYSNDVSHAKREVLRQGELERFGVGHVHARQQHRQVRL